MLYKNLTVKRWVEYKIRGLLGAIDFNSAEEGLGTSQNTNDANHTAAFASSSEKTPLLKQKAEADTNNRAELSGRINDIDRFKSFISVNSII